MLKLSKMTDYGVLVLSSLAADDRPQLSASDIAGRTGIPEPTASKILKMSARAGLVISQRGAAGGYRLAQPADRISVTMMVEAFDGPIALTACVEGGTGCCSVESLCPMRHNWDLVNTAIRQALSGVSLRDMSCGLLSVPLAGTGINASSSSSQDID